MKYSLSPPPLLAGINLNISYLEIWKVSFLGASGEWVPNFSSFFEVSL